MIPVDFTMPPHLENLIIFDCLTPNFTISKKQNRYNALMTRNVSSLSYPSPTSDILREEVLKNTQYSVLRPALAAWVASCPLVRWPDSFKALCMPITSELSELTCTTQSTTT